MSLTSSESFRDLRSAGYFVAVVTIVAQLVELILRAWPPSIHSPAWRLSLVGGTASASLMVLFMMLVLLLISTQMGDRMMTLVLSGLSVTAAVACLVLTATFVLDALQLRNQVRMAVAQQFDVTSVWIVARQLLAVVGFTLLALAGLRNARSSTKQAPPQAARGGNFIVGVSRPAPVAAVDDTADVKGG